MLSTKLATLAELDSVLGVEDLYLLREIALVDQHNQRVASQPANPGKRF